MSDAAHPVPATPGRPGRAADYRTGRGMSPVRIQRRRIKGWRMPEGAVYVGRPSRWGNPFDADKLGQQGSVDAFVVHIVAFFGWDARAFAQALYPWHGRSRAFDDWIGHLRGKDLACWCPLDQPCHADVLLEWANR